MQFTKISKHIFAIILSYMDGRTFSKLTKLKKYKDFVESSALLMDERIKFGVDIGDVDDDENYFKYMKMRGKIVGRKKAKKVISSIIYTDDFKGVKYFDSAEIYFLSLKCEKERSKRNIMFEKLPNKFLYKDMRMLYYKLTFIQCDLLKRKDETDETYCKMLDVSKRYNFLKNALQKIGLKKLKMRPRFCWFFIYFGVGDENEMVERLYKYKYLCMCEKKFRNIYEKYMQENYICNYCPCSFKEHIKVFDKAEKETMNGKEYPKIWPWLQSKQKLQK
jgi:hypothetical protein